MVAEIFPRVHAYDLIIAENKNSFVAEHVFEMLDSKEFAIKLAVNVLMKKEGEHLIRIYSNEGGYEDVYIEGVKKDPL